MISNITMIENASGNMFHETTEDSEEKNRGGDGDKSYNKTVWAKEDKIKEAVEEWNEKSTN